MKAKLDEMMLPENRGKFVGMLGLAALILAIVAWQLVGFFRGGSANTNTSEYEAAQAQIKANEQAVNEMAKNDPNKVPDDWKPKVTGRGATPMPPR